MKQYHEDLDKGIIEGTYEAELNKGNRYFSDDITKSQKRKAFQCESENHFITYIVKKLLFEHQDSDGKTSISSIVGTLKDQYSNAMASMKSDQENQIFYFLGQFQINSGTVTMLWLLLIYEIWAFIKNTVNALYGKVKESISKVETDGNGILG